MPTGIDPSVFDVNQSIKNCSQGHVVADFNGCDKRLKATVNLEKKPALCGKIHKVLNQGMHLGTLQVGGQPQGVLQGVDTPKDARECCKIYIKTRDLWEGLRSNKPKDDEK